MARASYTGPADALERYEAAVAAAGLERKGAANPYTSHNGHMFTFLDPNGVVSIRLSDEDTEAFRSSFTSGDSTQYGRTMRGYSTVPPDLLEDAASLAEWIGRSLAFIEALPPK